MSHFADDVTFPSTRVADAVRRHVRQRCESPLPRENKYGF